MTPINLKARWVLLLMIATLILPVLIGAFLGIQDMWVLFVLIIGIELCTIGILLLLLKHTNTSIESIVGSLRMSWKDPFNIIGMMLVILVLNLTITMIVNHYFPGTLDGNNVFLPPDTPWWSLVIFGFAGVILAPIAEELAFRGIILRRWTQRYSINTGLILAALVFAAMHFHLQALLALFIIGLYLSVLYISSNKLILPICAHVFNNALAFVATIVVMHADIETLTMESEIALTNNELFITTAIGIVTLAIYVSYLKRHWPKRKPQTTQD